MDIQPGAFEDRVALVTGATSGIGAACARMLAARSARVMLTGRDLDRGRGIVQAIRAEGGQAEFVGGDLCEANFCDRLVEECLTRFDGLDILVNNAGIALAASAPETTDAAWEAILDTNLGAAFRLSRAALRPMLDQRSGAIVNVASDWGLVGGTRAVAYCASKGGLVLLTRAMALDHARDGIRINAVCPTDTDTPMMRSEFEQRGITVENGIRESIADIPMGRMADPEEVAEAVCFLVSDAARFLTGVALPIDGGATA
jgi:NAD(P)-dependent dehydrogenase (short-subunit alcohol dehydrogenase family)